MICLVYFDKFNTSRPIVDSRDPIVFLSNVSLTYGKAANLVTFTVCFLFVCYFFLFANILSDQFSKIQNVSTSDHSLRGRRPKGKERGKTSA